MSIIENDVTNKIQNTLHTIISLTITASLEEPKLAAKIQAIGFVDKVYKRRKDVKLPKVYWCGVGWGILMEKQKFEAMLIHLVPQVILLITENYPYNEVSAAKEFYDSKVSSLLEQEDTKLWHLSALTLFHMFDEETKTGTFTGVIMSKESNY